jgi:regulator of sigma E protease
MNITAALMTMIGFGSIIFIHEFGHYLAAKRVGVRVEKFYLGFDFWNLKLFKITYKNTEYGIGIFPLGGYVKLAGQEDFGKAQINGKPDEYTSKTVWQRIQILAAGVTFNFLSAFVFSALALYAGYELMSPEVGMVQKGSVAWQHGIKEGDIIKKYDYMPITSFTDIQTEVMLGGSDKNHRVLIERDGKEIEFILTPNENYLGLPSIGVMPADSLIIKAVANGSAAQKAGIKPQDIIDSINGVKINKWSELSPIINEIGREDKEITLKMFRAGEEKIFKFKPHKRKQGFLGIEVSLSNKISKQKENSLAKSVGIEADMVLLSIDGQNNIHKILKSKNEKTLYKLVLKDSFNEKIEVDYNGTLKQLSDELYFEIQSFPIKIAKVVPDSIAEIIGLKKGDMVQKITFEDEVIEKPTWSKMLMGISKHAGADIELVIKRGGEELTLNGKLKNERANEYVLGVRHDLKKLKNVDVKMALMWPFHMLRVTYKSMYSLISGQVSAKHISGPIGIVDVTYKMADYGLPYLLYLMAFISINLAFLNIMPLPVLDGGHILFCIIEGIKGSPVSENIMQKAQAVGMFLLLCLLMFATWNDITKQFYE